MVRNILNSANSTSQLRSTSPIFLPLFPPFSSKKKNSLNYSKFPQFHELISFLVISNERILLKWLCNNNRTTRWFSSENRKLFYLFISKQRPTINSKYFLTSILSISKPWQKHCNKTRDYSPQRFTQNPKYNQPREFSENSTSQFHPLILRLSLLLFLIRRVQSTLTMRVDDDFAETERRGRSPGTRHRRVTGKYVFCSLIRSFPRALASNALQRRYSSTAFNGTRHGESRGKIGAEVNEMQRTEREREGGSESERLVEIRISRHRHWRGKRAGAERT